MAIAFVLAAPLALAQESHPPPPPPPPGLKVIKCANRQVPQFTDITAKTNIRFNHISSSDNRYVVESMSGGVLLIDYDRDGFPDIYFTNAPTVDMAIKGQTARGARTSPEPPSRSAGSPLSTWRAAISHSHRLTAWSRSFATARFTTPKICEKTPPRRAIRSDRAPTLSPYCRFTWPTGTHACEHSKECSDWQSGTPVRGACC